MSTKRLEAVRVCKAPNIYYIPELGQFAVANFHQGVVSFDSWYVINKSKNYKKQTYLVKIDHTNYHCSSARFGYTIISDLEEYLQELQDQFWFYAQRKSLLGIKNLLQKVIDSK